MSEADTTSKALVRRCPRLGSPVAFTYCLSCEPVSEPCSKIMDCWWETFDVVAYLRDTLPEEQFNQLLCARPKAKICSLVELIEQAKQRR
jgi:hypothetical protein